MKLHRLLALGMMAAGAAAAIAPLRRRHAWDAANRTVRIALDYDDTVEAGVRAGLPLGDLLHRLWHAGATHLTVPEDTLDRLLVQGRVGLVVPRQPLDELPPVGGWTYLATHEDGLLARLHGELSARQPQLGARLIDEEGGALLAIGGALPAIRGIGLGFDPAVAAAAQAAGLQPLPRPTSYPWPTRATIERTLAQAAEIAGDDDCPVVAFHGQGAPGHVGELILGHEMLMHETIDSLRRHGLAFAYFAESRHQRGDWFVAKSLAPDVVLAHEFTQPEMIAEDMFSIAHRWGLLAREKGIRLCVLQLFKVVHATAPLDCVAYVAAVADVLINREGMTLDNRPDFRPEPVHHGHSHSHGHHHHDHSGERATASGTPEASHHHQHEHGHDHHHDHAGVQPARLDHDMAGEGLSLPPLARDDAALPWLALIPAGAGSLVLADFLDLPVGPALAVALAGLAAPPVVARLDRPGNALEATFRPSYAPKLIALGTLVLAPLAAALAGRGRGALGLVESLAIQAIAAAGLAATVAEQDYALRIEAVKAVQLDWILPLSGVMAAAALPSPAPAAWRVAASGGLAAVGLLVARAGLLPLDPLTGLDAEHSAEHTHHLSRAQATLGDARMAVSPRPLRKWTGPTLAVQAAAALLTGRPADVAAAIGALGGVAYLAGFRQAARPFDRTVADRMPFGLRDVVANR